MRRAQVNDPSQPRRNGSLNPSFQTQGSLINVRQNLATDPRATAVLGGASAGIGWMANRWFGNGAGTGTYTLITGAVDGPIPELTTYMRKTWTSATGPTTNNGDTGFGLSTGTSTAVGAGGLAVTAGTIYTASAYLRTSASGKANAVIDMFFKDSAGTFISRSVSSIVSLTAGVWTRIFLTATAPAGATTAGLVLDVDGGTLWAQGDTLDGTGLLVEASPALMPFFSGATAAAGDFSYGWSGTANSSTSLMRGTLVASTTGVSVDAISSTAWFTRGTRSVRMVPNSPGTTTDAFIAPGGDTGGLRLGMQAGKTYTAAATFRQDAILTGTLRWTAPVIITAYWRIGTGNYSSKSSVAKTNAIGVDRLSVTFTVPIGATEAFVRLYHGGQRGAGDVWASDFICVEGEYTGDYIDGTTPFSKWDGTANASSSVGYPAQLLDIAGKPTSDVEGIASTEYAVADPFAARTLYFVYDSITQGTNYQQVASYGIANSNGFSLQTNVIGNMGLSPRFDFIGGSSNGNLGGLTTMRTTRRHVAAFTWEQGLTVVKYCGDGGPDFTNTTPNPAASGWANGRLDSRHSADTKSLRILAYYANHDRATRLAISRYLGTKYGAYVA